MSGKFRAAAGLAVTAVALCTAACAGPASSATSTSASAPADGTAPVSNGAAQVKLTLTNDGGDKCTVDYGSAAAGPVTFTVENISSSAITEVELQSELKILGEKENLAPGLPRPASQSLWTVASTPSTASARPPRARSSR